MRGRKTGALCAAVGLGLGLLSVSAARADTIFATLTAVDPSALNFQVSVNGTTEQSGAGELTWSGVSTNVSPFNGTFTTYCIDIPDHIELNVSPPYEFTTDTDLASAPQGSAFSPFKAGGGMGLAKASEIQEMFAEDFGTTGTAIGKEAFQLAIWNIIYDTDQTVSTGAFHVVSVDAGAITQANLDLNDAFNGTDTPANDLEALIADPHGTATGTAGGQDQITINPNITTVDSPLPSSAWGGGLLATGLALVTWRKNRRARALVD